MVEPSCHTCVFAFWNPDQWLRSLGSGFPIRPACANHPDTPGVMRDIPPGGVCRNYRAKPAAPDLADGTVKRIPLGGGQYAYVDAADYEWLSQYKWGLYNGYAGRLEKGRLIFMHRQIMQPPKGKLGHGSKQGNSPHRPKPRSGKRKLLWLKLLRQSRFQL